MTILRRFVPVASALALVAALPASAARKPPPPLPDLGTVTLDRADPVVDATVAGVPARLAVSADAQDTIELAPSFSARPSLVWEQGDDWEVGRVRVETRVAAGEVGIGGVVAPRRMTTHDRPCCAGHDGEVAPLSLPWSTVRIGRATSAAAERRWPLADDAQSAMFVPLVLPGGTIRLILAPRASETVATAAAGAILAQSYGGRFTGEARMVPVLFGIERQVRDLAFDRPVPLLGFTVRRIAVRYADFAGDTRLPAMDDPAGGGIEVRHRPPAAQHGWAAIAIGRDLLDRCPVISVYRAGSQVGLVCDP